MKKIITVVLAAVLCATLSVTAFAESPVTAAGGSDAHEVKGSYSAGGAASTVYSVDITWGSMEFTYTAASEGTWNPVTLRYDNAAAGGWSCAADANKITVTNKSNAAVTAGFAFAKDAAVDVTGGFFDAATGGAAIPSSSLAVASAAPVAPETVGVAKTATAYLQITAGTLTSGQTGVKLGTVTVTIN